MLELWAFEMLTITMFVSLKTQKDPIASPWGHYSSPPYPNSCENCGLKVFAEMSLLKRQLLLANIPIIETRYSQPIPSASSSHMALGTTLHHMVGLFIMKVP